jgi:hypothetical protein
LPELRLDILNQRVSLSTDDPGIAHVLDVVFRSFRAEFSGRPELSITARRRGTAFQVRTCAGTEVECDSLSGLVYVVDKDLTVEVQRRRPDLLFVHAAVLQHGAHAILLAGDSGSGKSTTAWGLAGRGFGFMSDELAPIDPRTREVEPYPRALGLKRVPDGMILPAGALTLERTIHVPTLALGQAGAPARRPLSRVFFVRHDPEAPAAQPVALSAADTAARLYVLCLNALAHSAAGLDAVAGIAAGVRGYALTTADLEDSCQRLTDFMACA